MVEVKGKFIAMTAELMGDCEDARAQADQRLFSSVGRHWNELDAEGWYDVKLWNTFLRAYEEASGLGEEAVVAVGRRVYPTLERTTGLPAWLKTPGDYIRYEAEGYLANVRGRGVAPGRIIKIEDGHAVLEAEVAEYDCALMKGILLGLLDLAGVEGAHVAQTRCVRDGASVCEFEMTWVPQAPVTKDSTPAEGAKKA
jgi:hypothetical protein